MNSPSIQIPVDLTNPGQFFACCGLLELADRLWPGAEGWFEGDHFSLRCEDPEDSLRSLLAPLGHSTVTNTMTSEQIARSKELSKLKKAKKGWSSELEEEKKSIESLRRELPIVLSGSIPFCIDWFCDDFAGGSHFKTWAGQQSVLDIAQSMHDGIVAAHIDSTDVLWKSVRGIGLPFNFDSDLGGQGSARDIGFSFDPLAGSESTRIEGTCKPALELLCFIGLQRFRPLELKGENRFVYSAWQTPAAVSIASMLACTAISVGTCVTFEFPLLYRTKYLKSFLPAQPFQGERNE